MNTTTPTSTRRAIAGIAAAVALTIGMSACGSDEDTPDTVVPAGSDAPAETDVPAATDLPTETDVPADTEVPADTTAPVETDAPADT